MDRSRAGGIGRKIQRTQEDWSDDELPDIDFITDRDMDKKKKQRKQGAWSDDELPEIDYEYNVHDESEKGGLRQKQSEGKTSKASASKDSAAPTSRTKHHCILSGHIFRRERIPLRQDQRLGQPTKFDREDRRETCEDCKQIVVENLWVCEIAVCGRRVCGTCKRGWDGERAKGARETWRR